MADAPPPCDIPADLIRFERPLFHLARHLKGTGPVTIVAIGSSLTHGEGTVPPYPGRLQDALRLRFPGRDINVIKKGVDGEEAPRSWHDSIRTLSVRRRC